MGNWQSNNSLPIEKETSCSKRRNSLIAQDLDVSEELERAEMQPEKRQRKVDEQSMVIYGQEQGSVTHTQLTFNLDWLSNHSALYPRVVILKEKMERLYARQSDVLTELEHAEFQPGKKQREEVHQWLTEVQRIKNKVQSMIFDGQGSSSNSNLSGSVESFTKEVGELIQRSKFPNGLVLFNQESTRLPLLLDIKPAGTNFQQNSEKILGWLRHHEHCIIGVYGMGGVGKTTLLLHIHDQLLQDSNLFGHVYWVTVSQKCPIRKLQGDIAKVLGLASFQEDDERKRAAILRNRLSAEGRTVLILDDMWEQVSGSKVGIPLENSNCKIILSTRSYDVCRKMGCEDFVIKAEILHKGEAWDLFVEKLGQYDTLGQEVKRIAWDIAQECGGLPLAIATMARSMTDVVDINEWKTALNDLKSARDSADMKEDVFRILQHSYDRLNDKRVQECFLSCILYGEDERIRRTTLVDLWINVGLLNEIESRDDQVAKGHVILNKLESSCLLESALDFNDHKCVKMHDLIRDMAIFITKEHPLFIAEAGKWLEQVPKEEKWSKDLAKVSLSHNRIVKMPSGMAPMTHNLTVLMLNYNPLKEISDSFFVHMRALKVLDLSRTKIKRVPESVSELENLRALILAYCGNLIYVPSVAKLTKLRMLDLERCFKLKEAPRGLERLKSVEKLGYIPWDVSDVIGFNMVIQSLTSLRHYKILIRDSRLWKASDEWKVFHEYDTVVSIKGLNFEEDKGNWLLPTTINYLGITGCDMKGRCLGDVFQLVGEATGMKYIKIKYCRGVESISWSLVTTQLEYLELEDLPDLRSIAKGMPHSFSCLRQLYINECPKLKVVLPMTCSNQHHLPNLQSIRVELCKELEEIFKSNNGILSRPLVVLPKLKTLGLWCLPKVKVIFPCEEGEQIFGSTKDILSSPIHSLSLSLPKLEELELVYLPNIKVIFPFTEQLHLPNLKYIRVSCCGEVEEIFESNKAHSNPILSLPKLNLLVIINLPKLGSIYRGRLRCTSPVKPDLIINGCPKLKWRRLPGGDLISDVPCSSATMLEFPPETLLPYPEYETQWGDSLLLSLSLHTNK